MTPREPQSERHFAVLRLEEAIRDIRQSAEDLPAWRQKVEKYKDTRPDKAKDAYIHLQKLRQYVQVADKAVLLRAKRVVK